MFSQRKYEQAYTQFSDIFSSNMCGFQRGHSSCSVLVTLTDYWRVSLNNKKEAGVIAIDLSNAFASISHNLLLAKLNDNGSFVPF